MSCSADLAAGVGVTVGVVFSNFAGRARGGAGGRHRVAARHSRVAVQSAIDQAAARARTSISEMALPKRAAVRLASCRVSVSAGHRRAAARWRIRGAVVVGGIRFVPGGAPYAARRRPPVAVVLPRTTGDARRSGFTDRLAGCVARLTACGAIGLAGIDQVVVGSLVQACTARRALCRRPPFGVRAGQADACSVLARLAGPARVDACLGHAGARGRDGLRVPRLEARLARRRLHVIVIPEARNARNALRCRHTDHYVGVVLRRRSMAAVALARRYQVVAGALVLSRFAVSALRGRPHLTHLATGIAHGAHTPARGARSARSNSGVGGRRARGGDILCVSRIATRLARRRPHVIVIPEARNARNTFRGRRADDLVGVVLRRRAVAAVALAGVDQVIPCSQILGSVAVGAHCGRPFLVVLARRARVCEVPAREACATRLDARVGRAGARGRDVLRVSRHSADRAFPGAAVGTLEGGHESVPVFTARTFNCVVRSAVGAVVVFCSVFAPADVDVAPLGPRTSRKMMSRVASRAFDGSVSGAVRAVLIWRPIRANALVDVALLSVGVVTRVTTIADLFAVARTLCAGGRCPALARALVRDAVGAANHVVPFIYIASRADLDHVVRARNAGGRRTAIASARFYDAFFFVGSGREVPFVARARLLGRSRLAVSAGPAAFGRVRRRRLPLAVRAACAVDLVADSTLRRHFLRFAAGLARGAHRGALLEVVGVARARLLVRPRLAVGAFLAGIVCVAVGVLPFSESAIRTPCGRPRFGVRAGHAHGAAALAVGARAA